MKMQVNGIGVRSPRTSFFIATLVACAGLMSGVFQDLGGLRLAPYAMAQDKLKLDKKGDTKSAVANNTDPVLVVSLASLNKLMQDINYVTSAVGQPQAGGMFAMMAGGFAQGLDMSRPISVMVSIVDGSPEPIGMIPTPDVATMLKRLEGQTGPVDKLDDGTLVVAAGPSLVYIRQVGTWAVVARQKELLDLAPADPMSLLEDLGNNYTLAARLFVQEIPEAMREALVGQLRQGFEQAMAQQGDNSEGIKSASEDSIEQIEQLIREAEELMFGWNINPEEKIVTVDAEFIAAKGTEMAEMYSGQAVIPSKFASVIDDENAMYYHAAASIGPKVIERTRESMGSAKVMIEKAINDSNDMNQEAKTQVTELAGALIKLFMQTVEEGKFDIGVQTVADDGMLEVAAGMFVSDGNAAAKLVKDLAAKIKGKPKAPTFTFDEETYKGVALHSMKFAISPNEAELRDVFGDEGVLKIGTAAHAVYFATGSDSEKTLKDFIDSGTESDDPTDRPLGQMQVRLLPFLRLSQSIKANDVVAAMIDTLSQNTEADYLLVESDIIENGGTSYIEIGEGILKGIGAAIREVQTQKMKEMQQQGNGQF